MVIICKEKHAERIFKNYKNVAAYKTSPNCKQGFEAAKGIIEYQSGAAILPTNDEINALRKENGKLDKKGLKKLCKKAAKSVSKIKAKGSNLSIAMTFLVTMASGSRDNDTRERSKKNAPVLVFILDDEDTVRNKIITAYLKAMFGLFGIEPITDTGFIKDIFSVSKKEKKQANKGQKKKDRIGKKAIIKKKVYRVHTDKKMHCLPSAKGTELKTKLIKYFDIELRQYAAVQTKISALSGNLANSWAKSLTRMFTAENLHDCSKKFAKKLARRNKKVANYYKEVRGILVSMSNGDKKLKFPKVVYGQKKKKGKAVGAKMNAKKFIKYFIEGSNRDFLMLIYGHITLRLMGVEVGTPEYKTNMTSMFKQMGQSDFGKLYLKAAAEFVKTATVTAEK